MIGYKEIRDEAVAQIKAKFTAARQKKINIAAYQGTIDEKEIRRIAVKTPAILTSLLKTNTAESTDNDHLTFVTWLLYRATNADKLANGSLELLSAVIPILKGLSADWAYQTEKIESENLYTGSLGDLNISLWAVSWEWHIRRMQLMPGDDGTAGAIPDISDLELFEGYEAELAVESQTVSDTVEVNNVD